MPKISLIGSGQIGSIVGQLCLQANIGDVLLYDVVEGVPQGRCLDLKHFCSISGINRKIIGTNKIEDIENSDVIVITAGMQRKEGMSREDLIGINGKIMKNVAESVKTYSPNAFVICVSNPLDIMVNVFHKYSNLPVHKICGMAGILDAARFRTLLSEKLKVAPENINTILLGGHGDLMIPLQSYTSISGIPLSEFIKKKIINNDEVNEIIQKTRDMGAEIIKLCKMSATFAPAAAIVKMIKSYFYNENQLFTCAVYLNNIYKCNNMFVGATAQINAEGIKPVEFTLTKEEQDLFDKSINHVKQSTQKAFEIIN
ncbi:malate dehydrogenase [Hepatocystis sp. ex Piliocolobus tephrosceles]|nr:malate dehydrogenase [Hepatocystis sp. ex Piliocolobus tephrosceles]